MVPTVGTCFAFALGVLLGGMLLVLWLLLLL